MNRDPLQYYQILEVSPDASAKEIKLSYHNQAKVWHPDYNKAEDAMEHFQKISVAYDVLQDEEKRLTYDLLSQVYAAGAFPQMDNLSILKDKYDIENPFIRIFDLRYVTGKVIKQDIREEKAICDYRQAGHEILKCSLHNWALGWWSLKAFAANLRALFANFRCIGRNGEDNLKLLVHNAVAFHQENKDSQALASAQQAKDFANPEQQRLLDRFCTFLQPGRKQLPIPGWNYTKLKLIQLLIPFILLSAVLAPLVNSLGLWQYSKKENEITYFQKVRYNNGGEFTDDIVVSKIFNIPINPHSTEMLYHLKQDSAIMYGPGEKFDVMAELEKGHTLRVSGFTPDKSWFRVMLDNGDMGFVRANELEKGIGNKVPENSEIYQSEY